MKAEPLLMKSYNNNFTEKNILELMIETGLDFDEVHCWYQKIRQRINRFYDECPYPKDETLKVKSGVIGVKVEILKSWFEFTPCIKVTETKNRIKEAFEEEWKMKKC